MDPDSFVGYLEILTSFLTLLFPESISNLKSFKDLLKCHFKIFRN